MSTARKVLMFDGDSITAAGGTDAAGSGFRGKVFMARPDMISTGTLLDRSLNAYGTGYYYNVFTGTDSSRSLHQGANGQGLDYFISNIASFMTTATPTLTHMVIHLGINDVNANMAAATMLTKLGTLLDTIHTARPTVQILVMKIVNELYNGGLGNAAYMAILNAYNAGIPGVVSARSSYCNYGTMPTLVAAQFGDLQLVHPNAAGMSLMADAVVAGMAAAGW